MAAGSASTLGTGTALPASLRHMFEHEKVVVQTGERSGLPIIVAVHSTALGQALGGCRIKQYADWRDGLTDALRLSSAMSDKCAAAGLPNGGGKTVVVAPAGRALDASLRRAALLDVGDAIASFGGHYATGPDVGTGPADMDTIAERTEHVFCRPPEHGGSGDSSPHTAQGVLAAARALATALRGAPGEGGLTGLRFAILGLGNVGADVARRLAAEGATLVVADVDESKKVIAGELGATWVDPPEAFRAEVDVLVPAALGGLLTPQTIGQLACAAVCGPANNQLDEAATADLLHERGIVWAPDFVVSAGGVIYATSVEILREPDAVASARVDAIGETMTTLLATGGSLLTAATSLAAARRAAVA
jgi:glutamate dehydrogenase/leucine dehydrogenase